MQPAGPHHPRVRELLALKRSPAPDRIVVEGAWEHDQLLTSGAGVEAFFWCPEASGTPRAQRSANLARRRAGEVFRISERLLTRLSRLGRPDGLISVARMPDWRRDTVRIDASSLVLVADGVEYAGNLGTLIRTADAARVDCVLLTSRRVRVTHPAVYAASRGMVLTMPVLEFAEIADAAAWLNGHGLRVHLADPGATSSYRAVDYQGPTAFVVGSEGTGLSGQWHRHGFGKVSIPMLGLADSLNVALSAGILLFEARARKSGW